MKPWTLIGCLAILAGSIWNAAAGAQDAAIPVAATGADWTEAPGCPCEDEPPCGRDGHCWARAELLWWWVRGMGLPPLVTTGNADDQAGVIGAPGTAVLFGGDDWVNQEVRWGGRFTLGAWCDDDRLTGFEVGFLVLESQATPFTAGGNGSPVLARPFINAATGQPDAELVSFPDLLAGSVAAVPRSGNLYGVTLDLRENLCCGCRWRVDGLAGYRFLRYDESLVVREDLTALGGEDVVPGTRFQIFDSFATQNEFHGVNLGVAAESMRGAWSLELIAKLALGRLYQTVNIDGGTLVTVPGDVPTASVGGLLALSSNIGHYRQGTFSVLPELGVNLGWQARERLYLSVGYTVLWLVDAVRAGDQVDLVVNPGLLPPITNPDPQRPAFSFRESTLWVQGISLGAEFRY